MSYNDLILAFFPCIYFCENNQLYFIGAHQNLRKMSPKEKAAEIIQRSRNREYLYELALKLFSECDARGLRLIVENPFAPQHYLVGNFPYKAAVIDNNRVLRGDFYNKPTQYWFINCKNTTGLTEMKSQTRKAVASARPGKQAGICSEDRSMISPDYARNFIHDFVLGKPQVNTQLQLFNE